MSKLNFFLAGLLGLSVVPVLGSASRWRLGEVSLRWPPGPPG